MVLLKTLILKEIIVALMIINAINHSPLSSLSSRSIQPIFSLFFAFKCEIEEIFALKRVKNPEKYLKFGSKTKLNAKGERALARVGGEVYLWDGVWWGKPGDRGKSLLYIDVKLSPCNYSEKFIFYRV